ncbi:MAG: hypothetical protein GPI97_12385 [Microcystis aeruginosa W13-16]|nr:hypothetical protein [Microcystis aeruginosa W13-16]
MNIIAELDYKLQRSKEFQNILDLRHFDSSYRICIRNYNELLNILKYGHSPDLAAEILPLNKRDEMQYYMEEVSRIFMNFLSSSFAFMEFSRRTYRKYENNKNYFPDYQEKINLFFSNNANVQFIHKLRNYIVHYNFPKITFKMIWDGEKGLQTSIELSKAELLKYKEWNTISKQILLNPPEEIIIINEIERYQNNQFNFHNWFKEQLVYLHKEDFNYVKAMQRKIDYEFSLILLEQIVYGIAEFEKEKKGKPEDIFNNLLLHQIEIGEIFEYNQTIQVRVDLAIQYMNSLGNKLPLEIEEKIRNVFKTYYSY